MTSSEKRYALVSACRNVLHQNLALASSESLLILTDTNKRHIADYFAEAATAITNEIELMQIDSITVNGQEPDKRVSQRMLQSDVILMPLSHSLSWTRARMQATESGARIASMPRITEDIMLRTFMLDYIPIRERANKIADLFDVARSARITTKLGTDLELDLSGRKGRGRKGAIYTEKGYWGNLPCGEAFIAPNEGKARGVYYVDASHAGVGKIETPIRIDVKDGLATSIKGNEEAGRLNEMLAGVGNAMAFNIAEFGIGCNHGALVTGISLEDEKALGTCHIALGSSEFFGGTVSVGIHVDGVITSPTILLDGRMVMNDGVLVH